LETAGARFEVIVSKAKETLIEGEPPESMVKRLALAKAESFLDLAPERAILSADTAVILNGTIYGKPKNPKEAKEILSRLSGKTHEVITAFCLVYGEKPEKYLDTAVSEVTFRPYSDREIDLYLAYGDYLDKAGAYAVQGRGISLIQEIKGSISNVMGLPLAEVLAALKSRFSPDLGIFP
jgi:septum formation protein